MKTFAALALSLLVLSGCKPAGPQTVVSHASDAGGAITRNTIVLSRYAVRAALGNNTVTAAYVTVENTGNIDDRLVSAACDCSQSATLHTMVMKNGLMDMEEPKDGFVLHPGDTLVFAPGGNHIMLSGLKAPLKNGDTATLTLTFEKAGSIGQPMPVSDTPLVKP